jgi:hypothetical protein
MPETPEDLVRRMISAEEMSPALRRSYQAEVDAMIAPPLSLRSAAPGVALLVILVVCVVLLLRNILLHPAEPLLMTGWFAMAAAFSGAAFLIARDLWLKKHSKRSQLAISHILTCAAGLITVVTLLMGLAKPSDPASTFHVIFALVFYIACIAMTLDNRIAAAELASREQMLRLEYRLAELGDLLKRE